MAIPAAPHHVRRPNATARCGVARRTVARTARRLRYAIPFATLLAAAVGSVADAQSCTGRCAQQAADQQALLASFNGLLASADGRALLAANLQKEVDIYLNSTQAEKIASGTILILPLVPANVLIRAFPDNPNYYYNAQGLPTAPALPASISAMVAEIIGNNQILAMKPYFGTQDVYGHAYGYLPGQSDSMGNPPPYQVSAAILNNPFTPANSSYLAWQNQQTPGTYKINWALGDSNVGDFPSAHTILATANAISFAILAPGYYQQLALSVADFSYALNVYAVHYPVDVIGGRILATYVLAKMLADDPLYASRIFNTANLPSLSRDMQDYFGGGASSPYAAACANLVACLNGGVIPTAATYTRLAQSYIQFLTYGLPSVGNTALAPVVPAEAHFLIATRYPYLTTAQLDEILYTTELPSGVPLDDGSGWARINLYAASSGYGAFRSNVTVTMNAARGGLNAFDVWSNNISGPGGLTLQGSGTLILAGDNTYTGGTTVEGGTLGVTGSLLGPLSVAPGARFVLGNTGTFTGDVINNGTASIDGTVSGNLANAGVLSGNGTIGSLDLLSGSIVAPGNSVGTIHVSGNLTVAGGTTYQAQVEGRSADTIQVSGTATLAGGTVVASLLGHDPVLGQAYPILTATAGLTGTFDTATDADLPFIRASLSYDTNDAYLTLTRNSTPFASVATTPNQTAVANALDAGPAASGLGLAITTQSAAGARRAFDALSGEVHASARTAMLADSRYLRDTLLGRMRQVSFAGSDGASAALAAGGPMLAYAQDPAPVVSAAIESALARADDRAILPKGAAGPATTYWTQGLGAWGRLGGDGNAVDMHAKLTGFFSGVDSRLGPGWIGGFAGGYTYASVNVGDRASATRIETAHLAGYTAAHSGPWTVRAAASGSFSTLDTSRAIAFPGFSDTATTRYDATTAQVFGEIAYGLAFGAIAAEPFGGLAFVHQRTEGFAEASAYRLAGLDGAVSRDDIGYATLGGRLAASLVQPSGITVTPRVSAAWQHVLGPVAPTQALTFQSTGAPFTIAGAPLARDSAVVETGIDLSIGPRARLGLSYSAQLGRHLERNAIQGNLTWRF